MSKTTVWLACYKGEQSTGLLRDWLTGLHAKSLAAVIPTVN